MARGLFGAKYLKNFRIFCWDKYRISSLGFRIIITENEKRMNERKLFKRRGKIEFAKPFQYHWSNRTKMLKTPFECMFIKKNKSS